MPNQAISELIKHTQVLYDGIGNKIENLDIPNEDKILIPVQFFDIVREYQAAVIILVEKELYHSAYVLTRSTFEAFIRGAWFKNCANLEQINNFKQGNNPPSLNTLIANLEETPLYPDNILSTYKNRIWGTLCSFAHTGYEHIASRYKDGYIQSNHSTEEISDLLNFINTIALLASMEVAVLLRDKKLEKELYFQLKNMYK